MPISEESKYAILGEIERLESKKRSHQKELNQVDRQAKQLQRFIDKIDRDIQNMRNDIR